LRGSVGEVASYPVLQTPDGTWRVEVYRQPPSPTFWYRLINVPKDNTVEGLALATVERLLAEAGVDMAALVGAA
jgi:bifunctional non-homologous end joining protein LigD